MAESSVAPATLSTGTLAEWFATPLGRYLLEREQSYFDRTLADIFGFNALQIGLPEYPYLKSSRISTRLSVDLEEPAQVLADPHGCRSQRTASISSSFRTCSNSPTSRTSCCAKSTV